MSVSWLWFGGGPLLLSVVYRFKCVPAVHKHLTENEHLRAEKLGISRLMTHDERQANAAREAGFDVVWPNHY